jgi:plastocyanin
MSRTRKILLYLVLPPVLFAVAIALVLFIYLQFHKAPEMDLTSTGFSLSTVEINEGESIHFVNQSNVTQVLCLGLDKVCDTHAVAPKALKMPGIQLKPGDAINVVFEQYGIYNITSSNVKGVNLKITVDAGA